jgi:transcriptional antiterminator NusG
MPLSDGAYNMTHKWYIAQAYSGYEKKVAAAIMEKVKLKELDDYFDKIVVPTEEVVEVKKGKKRNAERKFFPGYILIRMTMNDETYHLVKGLPKVSGFLGHIQGKPSPVPEAEINKILQDKPKPSITFDVGEQVRVTDGPFASFNGLVEEIDEERSRVKVSVSIFGRSTPVELEYTQVEKE